MFTLEANGGAAVVFAGYGHVSHYMRECQMIMKPNTLGP